MANVESIRSARPRAFDPEPTADAPLPDLGLVTVRNHIHNTLEKLRVHSKLEAVSLAISRKWVTGDAGAGNALCHGRHDVRPPS